MRHLNIESRHGGNQARLFTAYQQAVTRHAQPSQIVAKHHARHGQMERADAVEGDQRDAVRTLGIDGGGGCEKHGPILSHHVYRDTFTICAKPLYFALSNDQPGVAKLTTLPSGPSRAPP